MSSAFSIARYLARFQSPGGRAVRIARFLRSGHLRPKKFSVPRVGNQRVMPRMFRRGYGLGLYRRKRRNMRKRVYRKKTQNKVHSYIRWCDKDSTYVTSELGPNSISETLADQHLTYQFKLDNIVNPSDFTNLYDQYKINKIQLFLEPTANQTGAPVNNPVQRKLAVVHDYTDATPLASEDNYLEYSNCKRYNAIRNNAIKITLYPKIKNVVENVGGQTNAYTTMNSNRVWLDCDNDEVPHFGLKIFVPANISSNASPLFRVRAKFWLSFRNSK